MKQIPATILAASLLLAGASAMAQQSAFKLTMDDAKDGMKSGAMDKSHMGKTKKKTKAAKTGMKKDNMDKGAMSKDSMGGGMAKDDAKK